MRSSRALPFLALAASLLVPAAALAQDDDYSGESDELELLGFASASYAHSFQDTDLPGGGSFDDGNGFELTAGFQAGDYVVFTGGWEWQRHSDYTTHYFPVTVRGLSPSIAERVNLFGEASIGVFFSRLRNQFDNPEDDNERGSAVRLRAGVEVDIASGFSAVLYGGYLWGLGSTDDYEYGVAGAGLQYRWGL